MSSHLLAPLLPTALYLASVFIIMKVIFFARDFHLGKNKRNPLTKGLLRTPGYSLQKQLEDIRGDLMAFMVVGSAMPLLCFEMYRSSSISQSFWALIFYLLLGLGILGFICHRIFNLMRRARDMRLGMEAEMAAGQELNLLMKSGFSVYHDITGGGAYNIDHVVVGLQGVFAIETKGRAKRVREAGDGHRVTFENGKLKFPGWVETKPLEQARRNAVWVQKWLTSAIGEPVQVKPVLMLPGWYVERKEKCDVTILNSVNSQNYFLRHGNSLSAKQVGQIEHQLDARCRDVAPRAYVKDTEK